MNSSVTWDSDTSVMSSLCLEIRPSSRSKGPSNTSRCTWKPAGAGGAFSSGSRPSGPGKSAAMPPGTCSVLPQPSCSPVVAAAAGATAVVTAGPAVATVMAVVQAAGVVTGFTADAAPVPRPPHHDDEQYEDNQGNPDHRGH